MSQNFYRSLFDEIQEVEGTVSNNTSILQHELHSRNDEEIFQNSSCDSNFRFESLMQLEAGNIPSVMLTELLTTVPRQEKSDKNDCQIEDIDFYLSVSKLFDEICVDVTNDAIDSMTIKKEDEDFAFMLNLKLNDNLAMTQYIVAIEFEEKDAMTIVEVSNAVVSANKINETLVDGSLSDTNESALKIEEQSEVVVNEFNKQVKNSDITPDNLEEVYISNGSEDDALEGNDTKAHICKAQGLENTEIETTDCFISDHLPPMNNTKSKSYIGYEISEISSYIVGVVKKATEDDVSPVPFGINNVHVIEGTPERNYNWNTFINNRSKKSNEVTEGVEIKDNESSTKTQRHPCLLCMIDIVFIIISTALLISVIISLMSTCDKNMERTDICLKLGKQGSDLLEFQQYMLAATMDQLKEVRLAKQEILNNSVIGKQEIKQDCTNNSRNAWWATWW